MPNEAYYMAITHTGVRHNPHFEMENILITTVGYHNFEITLIYDDDGHILSTVLHRVYYRYAFYNTANIVKSAD
jgi:hypothetical protein